ncbi:unnamed protein product, partial [Ascophyllum nodosum]
LSALALASVSTISLRANALVAACGSEENLRIDDATGLENLKAAVNCSGGGSVVAVWSGDVTLESPVLVGSGTFLAVLGQREGGAVARGGSQTRLFEVSPGAQLTLSRLKIAEGSAPQGGAILSYGSLTLDTCEFDGNVATNKSGGAVWAGAGDVTISGVEFSGNSATSFGGAVFTLGAELVIDGGARFDANQAEEGGAVYCRGSNGSSEDSLLTASCTLRDAVFLGNNASMEKDVDLSDVVNLDDYTNNVGSPWRVLFGGGAATFVNAEVNISNCDFIKNSAQVAGGALYGGNATKLNINGCTFEGNSAVGVGGAVAASSATFGGGTELRGNNASSHGGGIFLWDDKGKGIFNDFTCAFNAAGEYGGCMYGVGIAVINDDAVMQGNLAEYGGCIYAFSNSDIEVAGGTFKECRSSGNGGFLFARDGAEVKITGGNIVNNLADRRGAGVYSSGPSFELGGSNVIITGGTFDSNKALELGGALVAWGTPTTITVKGGNFKNNTGQFHGGFVFLEEGASISCERATIVENHAGDQGGGVYARDARWVNSSCNLIANEAPQGAAAYLTYVKEPARFENLSITDNVASSGGSVFYVAESSIFLTGVTFETSIVIQEDSSNRAVQLDEGSTLFGDGCAFSGWLGDTVVRSTNPDSGSLVLNSCDFRGNFASMMVVSSHSDAEIRNALVDEITLANAAVENGSVELVDRALNCSAAGACGHDGECVDSVLGVLCVCIDDDTPCLIDGGTLALGVTTDPANVTYNPNPVKFELTVSAKEDGITLAIWNLSYWADGLELEVVPESGVLPPGESLTINVAGTPVGNDVGGNLASTFTLISVGNSSLLTGGSGGIIVQNVEVRSTFYLCQAFQYAVPTVGDASTESVECKQCAAIIGAEGVDCIKPGATQASLPIRKGYWRANGTSLTVHSCLHSKACKGATVMTSSEDYCADGYQDPLCAVRTTSFGRGAGYSCHSCRSTLSTVLITVGSLFILLIVLLFVLTVVFLVGGLDAVGNIHRSLTNNLSISMSVVTSSRPVPSASEAVAFHEGPRGASFSAAFDADSEPPLGAPNSDTSVGIGRTTPVGVILASPKSAASTDGSDIGTILMKMTRSDKARRCCGIWQRIKRLWSRVPLDKLKILVVVWQILTVFPSIAAVDFPPVYSQFLSWIDVINFDLANIFSASCVFPGLNFYQRLLVTTLAPVALIGVLMVTYQLAKMKAGTGMAGIVERRAAWSRHMVAGLLLTFLVFTPASTVVFKIFGCDKNIVEGESYLRADYSISCKTNTHTYYRIYAGFMLMVYPIGIPLLYAFILWKNRHLLNPTLAAAARAEQERQAGDGKESDQKSEDEELEKKVKLRRTNPELVPSMFLWKDFGPDLYYYEVIECGRRILLTGVLIFIAPYTASQAAAACIFAFGSLLGFELLRPHLDPTDSWLYRLGCVVIFLSNFLALLIKVDAAGEGNGETLGALLVTVNVMLVVAVILTSWFSTQQQVDE